jgi:superfamily II DNA or RNA helicase
MEHDKIILITYQSLKLLFDVVKENELEIDLICFDEAHHILADGMKLLLFGTDEDDFSENFIDTYVKKALYFTATPKNSNGIKMYEPVTDITIGDQYYEIVDDDNSYYQEETHCGKMVFEYMHTDGVRDNILNDFNIRVDLYTESTDESVFEAISRAILETGNSRVLTFHSRSETKSEKGSDVLSFTDDSNQKKFKKCFDRVLKKEFPKHKGYKKIHFKGITAATKNKVGILKQFDDTPDDEIFILASCKTIGEGTDVPGANMVVFIDPKQSYVEIIQNIGRICRKNEKTKRLATVLIPCYVDVGKYKECKTLEEKNTVIRNEMSKTGDFNGILNVLSGLRQEDPYMFEMCLKHPEVYTEKEMGDNLRKHGLECSKKVFSGEKLFEKYGLVYDGKKSEEVNFKKLGKKIDKNIQVMNNRVNDADLYVDSGADETMYLVKRDDDKYVVAKGKCDGVVRKCNRNVKPFVHGDAAVRVLWEIEGDVDLSKRVFGGYIKSTVVGSNVDNWMIMLEKVKRYIDKNGKKPSGADKNNGIRQMGKWISTQHKNYKKKQYIMSNEDVYKKWNHFIKDNTRYFMSNDEEWKFMLDNVKKYIIEHQKKPLFSDNNINIQKMASWLTRQLGNYNSKKQIMANFTISKIFEKFLDEYKMYFAFGEEYWKKKLNDVKNYIDTHKKRPSCNDSNIDVKKMSTWIRNQVKNYEKKQHVMQNDNIRELFAKFWENYKIYFMSYEMHWENMLNNVKTHIDKYGTKPSTIDKSESVKKLGSWLNTQQNIYDRQEHIMKNIDIRKKYEHFLKTYEEHFLSRSQQWFNTLDIVKKYIDVNKKRPSKHTNDLHVQKLANWLGSQTRNYAKKENIMKYDNVRESWEQFITSHQQYFPDNPAIQTPEKHINNEPVQKLVTVRDSTSQKTFKDELLKLHNNKCMITGSTKPLEGAHIIPYSECNNFKMNNGLLLRNDIHALFDDFDITINPGTMKVELSKELQADDTYKIYHMKQIKISDDVKTNLMAHYKRFMDKHGDDSDEECKPKKVVKKKTKVLTK